MGSNYYGEANLGNNNERGRSIGSSSSSSRKGKKSSSITTTTTTSNSDKPKQPQRGLGVAQLEKMRLHGALSTSFAYHQYPNSFHAPNHEDQMRLVNNSTAAYCSIPSSSFCNYSSSSSSPSYGFNTNIMMGLNEYERANIRYGDSQPCTTTPSWDSSTSILDNPHFVQPNSNSTGHLLNQQDYHEQMRGKRHTSHSRGSSSPNYELSENEELDLELRLAL